MGSHTRYPGCTRGVTLVEVVVSMVILAGAMAALLTAVTSSRATHAVADQRRYGMVLADQLMSEILAQTQYKEGDTIGRDSGESAGNRADYDDIDDYDGWSASPPEDKGGTPLNGAEAYWREVSVQWVGVLLPGQVRTFDTGLKRITVTVKLNDRVVAELVSYRSDVWQDPAGSY